MPAMYGPLDLVKNELRNAVIQNVGTPPASPVKGQIYFDSSTNILYYYNGTSWIASSSNPATTVTTQAVGDAATVGSLTSYAREDHKHGREGFGSVSAQGTFGLASTNGVSTTLSRADHAHGTPSHLDADHATIHLNALAAPTAAINMNSQRITSMADPTGATDATTKQYVDNLITGMAWKAPVRAATTVNGTLATAFANGQVIDGVTLVTGDRILLKNQTSQPDNGIYTVTVGAPVRGTDNDSGPEMLNASVWVEEGTTQADTAWVQTANAPITITSTPIVWVQFAGSGAVTAGAGMTQSGNVLNVVAGDTSLTVNADELHVNTAVIATVAGYTQYRQSNSGNGLTSSSNVDTLTGHGYWVAGDNNNCGGTLPSNVNAWAFELWQSDYWTGSAFAPMEQELRQFGTTWRRSWNTTGPWSAWVKLPTATTGTVRSYGPAGLNGNSSPEVITHNLGTRGVTIQVANYFSPYTHIEVDWDATTTNTVTIRYNPNLPGGIGAYGVTVFG